MKRRNIFRIRFILITIIIMAVAGIVAGALIINKQSNNLFSPPSKKLNEPITKDEPVTKCKTNDKACGERNEKIMVNKLQGQSVSFAKHQCDGPRACPTPEPKISEEAISAIRVYANDKTLEFIRITGINATGFIFYCSQDNHCWSYEIKTKKVKIV